MPIARPPHLMTAVATAVVVLLLASDAMALDAYKDRRGIFAGLGVGGGVGAAAVDDEERSTGFDDERLLGMHLSAVVGGGVYERLTLGAEGNWWIRTVQIGDDESSHQQLSFNAVADFFVLDGLYALGGVGLAYAVFDSQEASGRQFKYRELGLAAKAGAGFEFFLNGTVAAGLEFAYTRHFYTNADFDTLNGGITLRWY